MTLVWINAAALAGLVAVLGPVVVHLLRRQRARRVPFPTVQFLVSTRAAAARIRTPSDLPLLALRVAIVAAAAIAAAQPFLATGWRRAAWERRIARALVIDTSESMAPAASRVADAVAAERQASPGALEIRTGDLRAGLEQAVSALDDGEAGRTEIVVFSDFHKGSLTAADIAALPAGRRSEVHRDRRRTFIRDLCRGPPLQDRRIVRATDHARSCPHRCGADRRDAVGSRPDGSGEA